MDDFINRIYDNQSTNSNIFDQDLTKFTDVGSPKSMHSQKSNKTFKQLLNENYSEYFSRLKHVFSTN
jgi:hypothetical protein